MKLPGKDVNKRMTQSSAGEIFNKYGIYFILLLLILISSFLSPTFFTSKNLLNVSRQVSVTVIIALCEMVLMIAGNINLAAGSQLCLAGIVSIYVYVGTESMFLAIVSAIGTGALLGAVNGVISSYMGVPAFITTLATNMVFRGSVNLWTKGQTVSEVKDFAKLGQGYIGIIPVPVIIMLLIVIIMAFVINRTILGRRLLAIGGNEAAANATGVNVRRYTFIAFMISGALAGLAGVIHLSRLNMGMPTAGDGYEMDAIAGAVIGGTSMAGGVGSAVGVLVGSLIIGVINNIMNLKNVMSYAQDVIKGIIIVVAVLLDMQTKRKKK